MPYARAVEVAWDEEDGGRVPILQPVRRWIFGEPLVAIRGDARVHGRAGWDPVRGWVMILDLRRAG